MMAQKAALKAMANRELRLLLARNRSLDCTDVEVGVSAPLNKIRHPEQYAAAARPGGNPGYW